MDIQTSTHIKRGRPSPVNSIVNLDEARRYLGIYGDVSIDPEIGVALGAAKEKISNFVGKPIDSSSVVEFFKPSPKIRLAFENMNTPVVEFMNRSGTWQSASINLLDLTTELPVIHVDVPEDIDDKTENPMRVTYESGASENRQKLKQAILVMTQDIFESRNSEESPKDYTRILNSLLSTELAGGLN